jgi:hypothetical protein
MKFNPKQPYGTITGHPWARYEQGGVLYDWNGESRRENPDAVVEDDEHETTDPELVEQPQSAPLNNHEHPDFRLASAKEFLKNILSSGPLARAAIYREAEQNNQDWEAVKSAFADLRGEAFKRKTSIFWKLDADKVAE